MKKALITAKGGSIKVRMNVERAWYLQSSFGTAWNSATDRGVDCDDKLKAIHKVALSTYIRTKSIQFINMIRGCCLDEQKDCTWDSEALLTIICKVEYNDFSDTDWGLSIKQTWLNPAVCMWVEMLNLFEGINDAIN